MPFELAGPAACDHVINIRVTAAQKETLREAAQIAGLTLSTYGRRRLLGWRVVAKADLMVVSELRRTGGLLKLIHNQSGGAYRDETARALRALAKYLEQLPANDR